MQIALFLLLAVTASMMFSVGAQAFAQSDTETPSEEEISDEMVDEEISDEELADDGMLAGEIPDEGITDEELADDGTMTDEEVMELTMVDSPLKQVLAGIDPHEIQCKDGQRLVFKASNWRPACINESSFDILAARGWVASHDPSHEDLTKMQEDYVAEHMEEVEETEEETEVEIEEDIMVEEDIIPGNSTETDTEEAEPQNYTVELREDMEMGAQ